MLDRLFKHEGDGPPNPFLKLVAERIGSLVMDNGGWPEDNSRFTKTILDASVDYMNDAGDEVTPTIFVVTKSGSFGMIPMDGGSMDALRQSEEVRRMLHALLSSLEPRLILHISSVWIAEVNLKDGEPDLSTRPSDNPNAMSAVAYVAIDEDGISGGVRKYLTTKSGNALKEWVDDEWSTGDTPSGAMVNVLDVWRDSRSDLPAEQKLIKNLSDLSKKFGSARPFGGNKDISA